MFSLKIIQDCHQIDVRRGPTILTETQLANEIDKLFIL